MLFSLLTNVPQQRTPFPPQTPAWVPLLSPFPYPQVLPRHKWGWGITPRIPAGLAWCCSQGTLDGWMENPLQSRRDGHIRSSWLKCLQVDQGLGARLPQAHGVTVLLPAAPPPRAERSPLQLCPPYLRPPQVTGRHHLPPLACTKLSIYDSRKKTIS